MRVPLAVAAMVFWAAIGPAPTQAQSAAAASAEQPAEEWGVQLASGQRVRGLAAGPFEGVLVSVRDDHFFVDPFDQGLSEAQPGQPFSVSLVDLQNLEVQRSRRGRGAALGAVLGGAAGSLVVWAREVDSCTGPPCRDRALRGHPFAIVVGSGVGALVGWVIGNRVKRWEQLVPSGGRE